MGKLSNDIQLYNVGDNLYRIGKYGIDLITIMEIKDYGHLVYKDNKGHSFFDHNIGKSYFNTLEEAEINIRRRALIKRKRNMLKEYERKLNEELDLKNHYIVK